MMGAPTMVESSVCTLCMTALSTLCLTSGHWPHCACQHCPHCAWPHRLLPPATLPSRSPPAGNRARSVDSMRRPRPTFNLQLLSQRANFSTTSHVTWGGGGGTKYVSRVFTSDWLVVAFYLEFGRSGLLEIGLPVVNRRGSQWKSCYVLCWRYCHCIGTLSQKRVGINFGVDCNFAKQQPRGGSCNPVSDRGATFNPNH